MSAIPRKYKHYLLILWGIYSLPFIIIIILFILLSNGKLGYVPTFEDLENPQNNIASEIWSSDSILLSKYTFTKKESDGVFRPRFRAA